MLLKLTYAFAIVEPVLNFEDLIEVQSLCLPADPTMVSELKLIS